MTLRIANAPCSWGVEFADDPRNPAWTQVLDDCVAAGYKGIELGPVGYMPEDASVLGDALAERGLALVAGVVFRAFHDPAQWEDVLDGAHRTARALKAHGAKHMVLIDSISPRRAPTAGRPSEAERMGAEEWHGFASRFAEIARIGTEEYGLDVSLHPHAAGFMDFEEETERLLGEIDADHLKLCFDTGHAAYAGYDPVAFMRRHMARISYMHFKDIDPAVKADAIANRTGFYEACAKGIFCNLGDGEVDFPAVRALLVESGF
ncbi:MAG: TIM barrel protein, partial [Pseudomonadota bacterium]